MRGKKGRKERERERKCNVGRHTTCLMGSSEEGKQRTRFGSFPFLFLGLRHHLSFFGSLGIPHLPFPWAQVCGAAVPNELLSKATSCQRLGVMLPSYSCWGNLKLELLYFRACIVSITAVNECCFSLAKCEAHIR